MNSSKMLEKWDESVCVCVWIWSQVSDQTVLNTTIKSEDEYQTQRSAALVALYTSSKRVFLNAYLPRVYTDIWFIALLSERRN